MFRLRKRKRNCPSPVIFFYSDPQGLDGGHPRCWEPIVFPHSPDPDLISFENASFQGVLSLVRLTRKTNRLTVAVFTYLCTVRSHYIHIKYILEMYILSKVFILLEQSWFTMLCHPQVDGKVIQLHISIDLFFFRFFSQSGYCKTWSRVPNEQ